MLRLKLNKLIRWNRLSTCTLSINNEIQSVQHLKPVILQNKRFASQRQANSKPKETRNSTGVLSSGVSYFRNHLLSHIPKNSINIVDYRKLDNQNHLLTLQNEDFYETISGENFRRLVFAFSENCALTSKDEGGFKVKKSKWGLPTDFITEKQTMVTSPYETHEKMTVKLETFKKSRQGEQVSTSFVFSRDQVNFLLNLFSNSFIYRRDRRVNTEGDKYAENKYSEVQNAQIFARAKGGTMLYSSCTYETSEQKELMYGLNSCWWRHSRKDPIMSRDFKLKKNWNTSTFLKEFDGKGTEGRGYISITTNYLSYWLHKEDFMEIHKSLDGIVTNHNCHLILNNYLQKTVTGEIPENFIENVFLEVIQLNFVDVNIKFIRQYDRYKTALLRPLIEFQIQSVSQRPNNPDHMPLPSFENNPWDDFSVRAHYYELQNKYIYNATDKETCAAITSPPTDNSSYMYMLPEDQGAVLKYGIKKVGDCEVKFSEFYLNQLIIQQVLFVKYALAQGFLVFDPIKDCLKFKLEDGLEVNVYTTDTEVSHDMPPIKSKPKKNQPRPPISTVKNLQNFRELWGIKNPPRRRGLKVDDVREFVNVMNLNRSIAHSKIIIGSTKKVYTEVDGGIYSDKKLDFTNEFVKDENDRGWKKDTNRRFNKMDETRARSESIVKGIVGEVKSSDRKFNVKHVTDRYKNRP